MKMDFYNFVILQIMNMNMNIKLNTSMKMASKFLKMNTMPKFIILLLLLHVHIIVVKCVILKKNNLNNQNLFIIL